MACYRSFCPFDTLTDPWNVGAYVCMCVIFFSFSQSEQVLSTNMSSCMRVWCLFTVWEGSVQFSEELLLISADIYIYIYFRVHPGIKVYKITQIFLMFPSRLRYCKVMMAYTYVTVLEIR
jgi:hypothetical protein